MGIVATPPSTEYPEFAIRWTRDDCPRLEKAGVLNYRYELVDGFLVNKSGQHKNHNASVIRAIGWLIGAFGIDYVQSQATMDVAPEDSPTSEPEPDVVLLRIPQSHLPGDNPTPDDVRLCIEVSDTTLQYDLNTKARLYARAGIAEYWVINLTARSLYIHTKPQDGEYGVRTLHDASETVALVSAPDAQVSVADLLPAIDAIPTESDLREV